ncbi:MAG: hypothetical protein ACYDHX_13695 [Methanothrix sp.]
MPPRAEGRAWRSWTRSLWRWQALEPEGAAFPRPTWERALDPKSNVALRANTGGPAPAETQRMIKDRLGQITVGEERLAERRGRVDRALEELRAVK